jgi:hypothetical protein
MVDVSLSGIREAQHEARRRPDVLPPMNGLVEVGSERIQTFWVYFIHRKNSARTSVKILSQFWAKPHDEL